MKDKPPTREEVEPYFDNSRPFNIGSWTKHYEAYLRWQEAQKKVKSRSKEQEARQEDKDTEESKEK